MMILISIQDDFNHKFFLTLTICLSIKLTVMVSIAAVKLENRQHGAQLLAERLYEYKTDDTVIAAIPRGGMVIGYHLSELMQLPLEVTCCLRLKHPGDRTKTIGSVSADDVVVHDSEYDIPQEYIYYQIKILMQKVKRSMAFYNHDRLTISLRDKIVIVADDFVKSGDTMLASLKSIARQKPRKLVVATPLITAESMQAIIGLVDDVVFIDFISEEENPEKKYDDFKPVKDEEARALLAKARKNSFTRKLDGHGR